MIPGIEKSSWWSLTWCSILSLSRPRLNMAERMREPRMTWWSDDHGAGDNDDDDDDDHNKDHLHKMKGWQPQSSLRWWFWCCKSDDDFNQVDYDYDCNDSNQVDCDELWWLWVESSQGRDAVQRSSPRQRRLSRGCWSQICSILPTSYLQIVVWSSWNICISQICSIWPKTLSLEISILILILHS